MMKKRNVAALLAAAMLLSSCGASGAQTQTAPLTLTLWHYYNGAQKVALDELVTTFNATVGKKSGVTVEASNRGNVEELTDSVLAAAANAPGSDPMPALFSAYADTAARMDELGLLASLDPYLSPEVLAQYVPAYLDEGRLGADGTLKIMPLAKTTEVFLMNKTDWDVFSAQTGATLDELASIEGLTAVAQRYYRWTDAKTPAVPDDGKAFFGRDALANYLLIGGKQLGQELLAQDEAGGVRLAADRSVMKKLWNHYYVPYVNGWFAANGRFRSDDAKVGDIIALVGSATTAAFFPKEVILNDKDSYPVNAIALEAPGFAGGKRCAVQQGAGMAMTKAAPEREAAGVLFLQWLTEAENNLKFSIAAGYLPVKIAANDPATLDKAIAARGPIDETAAETLRIAAETVNTQELYSFSGSRAARALLERSLAGKVHADAALVQAKVNGGASRAEAAAALCTDENFEAWLLDLRQGLEQIQEVQ